MGARKRNRHRQKCKWVLFIFQIHFTVWGLSHVPDYKVQIQIFDYSKFNRNTFLKEGKNIFDIQNLFLIQRLWMSFMWLLDEQYMTSEKHGKRILLLLKYEVDLKTFIKSFVSAFLRNGTKPPQELVPHCQIHGHGFLWLFFLLILFLRIITTLSLRITPTHTQKWAHSIFFYLSRCKWFIRIISAKSFGFKNFK